MFVDGVNLIALEDHIGEGSPTGTAQDGDLGFIDPEDLGIAVEGAAEQHHVADAVHTHHQDAPGFLENRPMTGDQVQGPEHPPAPPHPAGQGAPKGRRPEPARHPGAGRQGRFARVGVETGGGSVHGAPGYPSRHRRSTLWRRHTKVQPSFSSIKSLSETSGRAPIWEITSAAAMPPIRALVARSRPDARPKRNPAA